MRRVAVFLIENDSDYALLQQHLGDQGVGVAEVRDEALPELLQVLGRATAGAGVFVNDRGYLTLTDPG